MSARQAPPAVSGPVRVTTVAAVGLVALVAAVVSYAHMQTVADRAGEEWRSWLVPLSVDGLVVAASMVLLTRRRAGLPGGALAWVALLGGVGASLAANVAAAEPTITARVVAAWPAVAFALGFELLLQQRSAPAHPAPTDPSAGERSGAPVGEVAATAAPVVDEPSAGMAPAVADPAPVDRDVARVAAMVATSWATGRPVGRRTVAKELGISEHRASQLLAQTNGRPR